MKKVLFLVLPTPDRERPIGDTAMVKEKSKLSFLLLLIVILFLFVACGPKHRVVYHRTYEPLPPPAEKQESKKVEAKEEKPFREAKIGKPEIVEDLKIQRLPGFKTHEFVLLSLRLRFSV